jgi:polysaccharide deacetylase family protein (PEP-CTERM system associated)
VAFSKLAPGSIMMTVDVEDWFHILDSPLAPTMERWESLPSRVEIGLERLLQVLDDCGVRATMFWLGWIAERHKRLVRQCASSGHEIASHGYGHLLPYKVGPTAFLDDIVRAKQVLEDITGKAVVGFRAPGFGITNESRWAFDLIRVAGYRYDSSVFPALRGHGGMPGECRSPHLIQSLHGELAEFPASVLRYAGASLSLFGGGYLRATPMLLLLAAAKRVLDRGQLLVLYIHPRELDPSHPRLPLPWGRRLKCYINIASTEPKLRRLLSLGHSVKMCDFTVGSDFADETMGLAITT